MVDASPLPADVAPQRDALRFMQRVRWLGAVFTVVQFWLYAPPTGITVPFDAVPTGLLMAAAISTFNLASNWVARRVPPRHLRALVLTGLAADVAVVCALVWLFRFDATSALWGLLVIPVLEAAVAAQMAGAIGTWAALTVYYVVREFDTAQTYDYAIFEVPSVTFRMGIVLIVAATAGSLARSLTTEARAQRAARVESQQRARLLHGLALSSQVLLEVQTSSDADPVWDAIVSAAVDVGFDAASINVLDPEREEFVVQFGRGLPDSYVGSVHDIRFGIAGAVWSTGESVVIKDYTAFAERPAALRDSGFGAVVGVPIRRGEAIVAVLVAGYHRVGDLPLPERECIELLAVHAGVALSTQAHFAERARYEARLTEMAYTDALTGLPNRDVLLQRLDQLLSTPDAPAAAVLFIDFDRFKTVNDSLGHHGGDAMLAQLGQRLVDAARPHLVTRFGGDEFTVLVEDVADVADAVQIARHIIAAVAVPLYVDGHEILPSASIGIRGAIPGQVDADIVLRDADTAMYRAKRAGRQRVEVHESHAEQPPSSLTLEAEMRRGLQVGEFELYYQPVVSLTGRAVTAVEALLRWNHPTRGLVGPAEFIPVAEDSGFIVPLGRWVLRQACLQAARWRSAGYRVDIAVNVSLVQLRDDDVPAAVSDALAESGLAAAHLTVEITESATVSDPRLMLVQAEALSALGVRLALDDFGQGATSLRFVRNLPLDVLKIDKSFVDELGAAHATTRDSAVVRSVIDLAHDIGLAVVAEGVEEDAQLAVLERVGCDAAQGYLLGRPVPAREMTALLQRSRLNIPPMAGAVGGPQEPASAGTMSTT